MFSDVRLQEWVSDEMVTAQRKQSGPLVDDAERVFLDFGRYFFWPPMVEIAIAAIDHRKLVEGIEVMNRSRDLMHRFYDARRKDPPPLTGAEALLVVLSCYWLLISPSGSFLPGLT